MIDRQASGCDFRLTVLRYHLIRLDWWSYELSAPFWRLYCNLDAGGWVMLESRRYDLAPGLFTLIPPNTPVRSGLDCPVTHLYIHFTMRSGFDNSALSVFQWKASNLEMRLSGRLVRMLRGNRPNHPLEAIFPVNLLVAQALTRIPRKCWIEPRYDKRVVRAIAHINDNAAALPKNAWLARIVNMSTGGFVRLFSREVGISPRAFALRKRIDDACLFLHHTDKKIEEIADLCGFWDRNYFTHVFKKHRGVTPTLFRKSSAAAGP